MIFRRHLKLLSLISVSLLTIILVLTGCNVSSPSSSASPGSTSVLAGNVTESGSTTVQPLAEKLAGAFKAVNSKVNIIIQGGGSSVGIKAANDGTVDIGASSRDLTSGDPQLVEHLLARDGIAIIVNPANKVNSLTKQQVRDIFSGKITNWIQVGGADKNINVSAREEGSGTRTAFEEMVMGKDTDIVKRAILQSSNGALLQVVKSDAAAISFVSFGYVIDNSVKALAIDNVEATESNVKNGTYPIVRSLYFLTKSQPEGLVKSFIDYCTSDEGQKIVMAEGYVSAK